MSKRYTVEIYHQETNYAIEVSEDEKILESARKAGIEIPLSCEAGVCTTCTAFLLEGKVEQGEGMGLSPQLQKEGYALLCVSYPRSDLKLVTEKEDKVYDRQFSPNT
ncbi:2Fe-2S iron-sulfur cluster-binding protein [Candidatus Atelocyanobacterium thalassae]|uniref:Ferredoxin, (2Fe-2S) n=2 Tax=Candidatus Atelocyanobacterium thalassae TaxID=713887 RepID=A0A086CH55_9CHRO|nr:2Fe-2S iron-sulfur cluster-binding protein [Candidatus Atelocyanobacterium thalassa]KFF41519.1 MAG: ferredoxin, (2Fe-2S) [Candidatus Atelocyanobacterium thalassa isolate SIO64986]BDA39546.1 ferredoxin [cyanobacterium endosymbiont of Braarudosphaera bigelowii]